MKNLLFIVLLFSFSAFSQSPTKGSLSTVDTIWKPTIKMLAINKLDNKVYYWDLASWASSSGSSGGGVTAVTSTEPVQVATGTTTPVISMKKASATDSGWVSTGTQTFAGAKAFNLDLTVNSITVGRGGASVASNTAVGLNAIASNTTGSFNAAFGWYANWKRKTGQYNSAFGAQSLYYDSIGTGNTAIGYQALILNTANFNTAVGAGALQGNTTGIGNTAVGASAMYGSGTTSGSYNSIYGYGASQAISTGTGNTVVGAISGGITSGSYNTFIGDSTARSISTGDKNTIIGARIIGLSSSLSNNIIISDGDGNQRINVNSSGDVGIGTGVTVSASAMLEISSTGKGFLPPRMTATEGSAIATPAEGLMIYVTNSNATFTTKGWWGFDGSAWQKLNN